MDRRRRAAEHAGDVVPVPPRHLGGPVQLQHVARAIVARDGAARLDRHAGVAADREIELHHRMRGAERGGDVAVGFFHHRGFGRAAAVEIARRRARIEQDGQLLDLHLDQIGRVLRDIRIAREHRRHRIAHIAHALVRQDGLAIGREAFDAGEAKIDRRNVLDVGERPHRGDAGHGARRLRVDRHDAAVRVRGAHEPHVQHVGKRDVGGEAPAAGDERPVFEARHRAADEAHEAPATRSAARMRCGVAGNSSIETPNGASASLIALTTAAGAPIVPPSPRPLALVTDASVNVTRWWISQIVGKARGQDVAGLVVNDFLEERVADALRDAAVNLPVDDHRIDEPAGVLGHEEFVDGDVPGLDIHLHHRDMARIGEGAGRIVGRALGDARQNLALEQVGLMIGGARQFFDRHRAVGAGDARHAILKHDVVGRRFEPNARHLQKLGAHLARRQQARAARDDERAAGEGAPAVGRAVGVAMHDIDAVWRDADLVGDDLRQCRAQALLRVAVQPSRVRRVPCVVGRSVRPARFRSARRSPPAPRRSD